MYYCWTHGLGTHRNITSTTCNHKADGHKDDATAFTMKGGNNISRPDVHANYRPPATDNAGSLSPQLPNSYHPHV
jgi:hypothetical protein